MGGPFYYIEKGLKGVCGIQGWKWLAVLFAVFGMGAGLWGIGTLTQVHGITSATQRFFDPNFNPAAFTGGMVGTIFIAIEAFSRGLAFLGPHSSMIASFFLMVALILLSSVVWKVTKDYLGRRAKGQVEG